MVEMCLDLRDPKAPRFSYSTSDRMRWDLACPRHLKNASGSSSEKASDDVLVDIGFKLAKVDAVRQ
jgi:hypothetical protein